MLERADTRVVSVVTVVLSTASDTKFMNRNEPDGTPEETLAQIPRVIKTVGALVVDPETNLGKAAWNSGRIMATADATTQWHCLDAAITVAQTLRDALSDLLGVPFTLTPPEGLTADLPANAVAGAHAAARMIHDTHPDETAAWRDATLTGTVDPQAVLGAYLMACVLAHQCVLVLAQGSGLTPAQAWKKARPLLMP